MILDHIRGDKVLTERYILATHKKHLELSKNSPKQVIKGMSTTIKEISNRVSRGEGFVLTGETGTGKTCLAVSSLLIFEAMYGRVAQIKAENMIGCISNREGYSNSGEHLSPVLFIDDVGRENERYLEFGEEIKPLEQIILERYDANYGVIFMTTNLDIKNFQKRYGDRVLSRLIEMSGKFITLKGDNFRYEQAKEN